MTSCVRKIFPPALSGLFKPELWLAIGLLAALQLPAQAPDDKESEHTLARFKAAVVFNFFEFATWPETAFANQTSPIRIAFIGNGPVADEFQQATRERRAQNRDIQTLRLQYPQPEPGQKAPAPERLAALHAVLKNCHAVYIMPEHLPQARSLCAELAGSPSLVFSDAADFIPEGGMIELGFNAKTRRIQFTVNLTVLEKTPTTLSSKLLKLAKTVRIMPPAGESKGGSP